MSARTSGGPTPSELLGLSRRELMELLRAGHPIDPARLDDQAYCGISLGLPAWVERLSWKKFEKVFHRDPRSGVLRGWNVRVAQNALDAPWLPLTQAGRPVTFGHFRVVAPAGHRVPIGCDRGLLIHYGLGPGRRLDPLRRLRDPIVALEPDSVDPLLGWSYLAVVAGVIMPTPSFFVLERPRPLSHRAEPPGR